VLLLNLCYLCYYQSALVSAKKQRVIKTLFCLVHGNPLKAIFPIDVDANDTIMTVREIIEKKIYIPDSVRAKDLTLWKVNVPYNEDATQVDIILKSNEEMGVHELSPVMKICDVFTEVPDNYIHIMVEIPNIVTGK
jgi:hypothetical protein